VNELLDWVVLSVIFEKTTHMKTIKIALSDTDISFIRSLRKEEEGFTKEAIEEKIARERRDSLGDLLKEGYQATREEDLSITNDFQYADFGNL
jgi:hypothetical protein